MLLPRHLLHNMQCILCCSVGMYKRLITRSTSTKRDSGDEEDDVSSTRGSIASSLSISPEEDEEEIVQVLLRVMNVVEFWIEHHYKVCAAVGVACGCGSGCGGCE